MGGGGSAAGVECAPHSYAERATRPRSHATRLSEYDGSSAGIGNATWIIAGEIAEIGEIDDADVRSVGDRNDAGGDAGDEKGGRISRECRRSRQRMAWRAGGDIQARRVSCALTGRWSEVRMPSWQVYASHVI